jgi:hypothetical protein
MTTTLRVTLILSGRGKPHLVRPIARLTLSEAEGLR